MKTRIAKTGARNRGWVLLVVMGLGATGILMMASIMSWSNENTAVTSRNNEYFTTTYAAESATEKAVGSIMQDYENYGAGWVQTKNIAGAYSGLIPTANDGSYWTNYGFSGGTTTNAVLVTMTTTNVNYVAGPPYTGLAYSGQEYEVIANAQNRNTMYHLMATVGQEVVLGQIPIFQFAIFYNDLLEIDPGANMTVNGVVHGNNSIYIDPNSGVVLTFSNDVSGSGTVFLSKNPLDPSSRPAVGVATFDGNDISGVNPLFLPVGTNVSGNTTNQGSVYAILQVPTASEGPSTTIGSNMLYNQCDVIVTISNGNVITVTSGVDINNAATIISNNQWASWISTNGNFYNMRDGWEVNPVDINVGALKQWSQTNTVLRPVLAAAPSRTTYSADVQSIYVVDQRALSNYVVVTNYSYTTNTSTTTTSGYPSANTFFPPVTTNTTETTTPSLPTAGTYVPPIQTTNVTGVTTTNYPATGTYQGSVSTNTVGTNSANSPLAGTYQGSVTTNWVMETNSADPSSGTYMPGSLTNKNGKYIYEDITSYNYNLIEYTYNEITGYIYNGITGYTYAGITGVTTNISYLTNYTTQFAEPGIVLTNGGMLPSNGLSVVTPDPAYIVGNWNCTNTSGQGMLQTYNVADTLPSAIYADAVTILSPAWNFALATNGSSINNRTATADTVNAALFTGIVPSDTTYYSGGVENFVRFQENWSGVNMYYNGSMVEMFTSQIADAPWPGTGTVYNPPNRYWAYDTNFSNPSGLPPLTPKAMYPTRVRWSSLTPGATSF